VEPHCSEPIARACRLYLDDPSTGYVLGDVARVHRSYTAKRSPAYLIAHDHGVRTPPGWLINANRLGLQDPSRRAGLVEQLGAGHARNEYVLDFGDAVRQVLIPAASLLPQLDRLAGVGRPSLVHAALVRRFVRGELGVISRLQGDLLFVDSSPRGLMALNRGIGESASAHFRLPDVLASVARGTGPLADPILLASVGRLTQALQRAFGDVTLEWVVEDGQILFVDYSQIGSDTVVPTASDVLAPGVASGPVLHLDTPDEQLERLSIGPAVSVSGTVDLTGQRWAADLIRQVKTCRQPPIVVARRPYAVLSVLVGHVAGFVFEQGALLSHLGIILREANVPAYVDPNPPRSGTAYLSDGVLRVLDDVGGTGGG